MSTNSKIEWTEVTWNPVTGCTKVSPGCKNCYADRMAKRLQSMGVERYSNGFDLTLQWDLIEQPLKWTTPKLVFVNSMSDLFHEDVPLEFIKKVFEVMNNCPQHNFQILTKRSKRLAEVADDLYWSDNIWMGVSVENQKYTSRIEDLLSVPAYIRFLSVEPLIGPIESMNLQGIDWVIVGGESGPLARKMEKEWVRNIQKMCSVARVPFFFKQWGGVNKKKTGRLLDGKEWNQMPAYYLGRDLNF